MLLIERARETPWCVAWKACGVANCQLLWVQAVLLGHSKDQSSKGGEDAEDAGTGGFADEYAYATAGSRAEGHEITPFMSSSPHPCWTTFYYPRREYPDRSYRISKSISIHKAPLLRPIVCEGAGYGDVDPGADADDDTGGAGVVSSDE
eukprot:6348959-Amphidinium_carterae.1